MASGSGFSRTFQGGHQPFYDFPCCLCEEDGKHVEAVKYCEECFTFMCDNCVEKIHNRIRLNTRHRLLDQGQFTTVNQSSPKSFPTKRCTKHPGEFINIFCGNHDEICCSVCKSLEHGRCDEIQYLPDVAKGILTSSEYQKVKEETQAVLPEIHKVLTDRKADIARIGKEKQQVKKTLADFRKRIDKYFDDLEKKSLNELDLKEKAILQKLEQEIKILEQSKDDAWSNIKRIDAFEGDNECDLFCQVKACKCFLRECTQRVQDMATTTPEWITLKLNEDIEKYLTSITTLGTFEDADIATAPLHSSISSVAAKTSVMSLPKFKFSTGNTTKLPSQVPSDPSDHCIKYETKLVETYDLRERSDQQICSIFDICQLEDGNILITDFANMKLKRLDQSCKVLDSIKLPCGPHSVCAAGPGYAAVSLRDNKILQFISTGTKLSLTKAITTRGMCRGLVYTDDKLYVCCHYRTFFSSSGYIEVYNNAGELQHVSPRLSSVPKRIIVSDNGQYLFVTSLNTDDISMLDLAGNVVNTFSSKKLRNPMRMCTDGKGHVFVCGGESDTVVQLHVSPIEVILNETDCVKNPRGLLYDRKMARLLVSSSTEELSVYTLYDKR